MTAIAKPRVEFTQVYEAAPADTTEPIRACMLGPNRQLHRYSEASEKATIALGAYSRLTEQTYSWPQRTAGSLVESDSVRLFVDNAWLRYFEDLVTQTTGGKGLNVPVSGKTNRIRNSVVNWKTNGAYLRSALLGDRDVQVGDAVLLRGVVDAEESSCETVEFTTFVQGFLADSVAALVGDPTPADTNTETTEAAVTITQIDGADNCVAATATNSYNGLPAGYPSETYTIEIIQSASPGCASAKARVTSASGTDNVAEVMIEPYGDPTAIGTRGLTVTWDVSPGAACSASAENDDAPADELVVGQIWRVVVSQNFERPCVSVSGTYTGLTDDTYIITVTKGGTWAQAPEVTITTVRGLDANSPQIIAGPYDAIALGNYGLTFQFEDCYGSISSSAPSSEPFGGDYDLAGLRKGDKWYVSVETGADGPIRTLILQDDIPVDLRTLSDLDLELFIVDDIELPRTRVDAPPNVNYEIESTQLVVKTNATAYHDSYTVGDQPAALELYSGDLYVEYHELLRSLAGKLTMISLDSIDTIPGQLAEENTLKWATYRALQNSNGAQVGVVAIADPTSLDSWAIATAALVGRTEVYQYVPLTYDREVWNLINTLVESESSPEKGRFKRMVLNLGLTTGQMLVGKSTASAQLLSPTSTDGNEVLAVVEDDPEATGTQYTRFRVPGGNAKFITYGVQPGDIVRCLYTVDPFGETSYTELVVDSVVSENTLLVVEGLSGPLTVAQKVEVWHPYTAADQVADIIDQAQSFSSRRVICTFPRYVGTGGVVQDGIHLAAAVAGLISGVVSHQPITFLEIAGFDDLTSYTTDVFTEEQLDEIAGGGVLICTEDSNGTPMVRHGLTSDVSDLKQRQEMYGRNVDVCSRVIINRLAPYVGKANVTASFLKKLRYEFRQVKKYLQTVNDTDMLGPPLIDAEIVSLEANPLFADTIDMVIDGTFPLAADKLRIFLRV